MKREGLSILGQGRVKAAGKTKAALNPAAGVPGYVDVKGVSFATNTLTVNSQTAYCKGEYFRKELSVANRLHHTKKKANQKIKMNCSLCKYSGLTPSRLASLDASTS